MRIHGAHMRGAESFHFEEAETQLANLGQSREDVAHAVRIAVLKNDVEIGDADAHEGRGAKPHCA